MTLPLSDAEFDLYAEALRRKESGALGKRVINKFGFSGLYQMGGPALEDAGFMKPGTSRGGNKSMKNPANWTIEGGLNAFLESPELQKQALRTFTAKNFNQISRLKEYQGKNFSNADISGLLATAHLKGVNGGAKQYLRGNVTRDAFNTPTSDYFAAGRDALSKVLPTAPKSNVFVGSQSPLDAFATDRLRKNTGVDDPESEISFTEAFQASRRESPILQSYDSPSISGEFDSDFNPYDNIEGYEEYADEFNGVKNLDQVQDVKAFIDENNENKRKAQGWGGFLGAVGYGLISPTTLIPGIGLASKTALKGMTLAKKMALIGGAGTGAAAGLDELMLQANDPTRTKAESLLNTAGAVAIGGLLFGGIGKALSRTIDKKALHAALEANMEVRIEAPKTAGAAQVYLQGNKIAQTNIALKAGLTAMRKTSPALRALSGSTEEGAVLANKLFDHNFVINKNLKGLPSEQSVEAIAKIGVAKVNRTLFEVDQNFIEYKKSGDLSAGASLEDFLAEVSTAARTDTPHANSFVNKASKEVKVYLQGMMKKLKEAKLLPDNVKSHNYLMRVFNHTAILRDRIGFTRKLQRALSKKNSDLSPEDLMEAAQDIADNILKTRGGSSQYLKIRAGTLKGRTLDLDDTDIQEFLSNDLIDALTKYSRGSETELAFQKVFGTTDLTDELAKVSDAYQSKIDAASTIKARDKLLKERGQYFTDIDAIQERLKGVYKLPDDPYSFANKAGRTASAATMMSVGGGIAVTQIADMAQLVMSARMPKFLGKEVTELGTVLQGLKLDKADLLDLGVGMETWLSSRASELSDLGDIAFNQSAVDQIMQKATKKFMNFALINQMNDFTRRLSAQHISNNLILDMQRLAAGTLSETRKTDLLKLGLGTVEINGALKNFAKHSQIEDGVKMARMHKWDASGDAFRIAIRKEVDATILLPGTADRSLWMSSPMGKVVSQFTGFSFAFQNKILLPGLQKMDAQFLTRITLMAFFGSSVVMIKDMLKGKNPLDRGVGEIITDGLDKAGAWGVLGDIYSRVNRFTGIGVDSLLTDTQRGKYYSKGKWAAILGPSAGLTENVVKSLEGVVTGNPTRSDMKRLTNTLPGQNLFYLEWLMKQVDKSIDKNFPKKRR